MTRYCAWCEDVPVQGRATYCSAHHRVEASRDRRDPSRVERRDRRAHGPRAQSRLMEKALRAIADNPEQGDVIARTTIRMVETMRLLAAPPSNKVVA